MIVLMHLYLKGYGESIFNTSLGVFNYLVSQYILIISSVSVNCFVLISSYFLADREFSWKRIMSLWFQTAFYSAIFAVSFFFLEPGKHSVKEIFMGFMPVFNDTYWFVSRYLGLVCLAPFLSKAVFSLSKRQYRQFLIALIVVTCTFSAGLPYGDTMGAHKGMYLIWFLTLFFWGGYIRRFVEKADSGRQMKTIIAISTAMLVFYAGKALYRYYNGASPLVIEFSGNNGFAFLLSVPVFLWFKEKNFRRSRLVKSMVAFAPFTFGVYLVHDNPYFRHGVLQNFIESRNWTALMNGPFFIMAMLMVTLLVFVGCACVDLIRKKFFTLFRVEKIIEVISDKLTKLCLRLSE